MAAPPPKDHRSSGASSGPRTSRSCNGWLADSDKRRRRSTSAASAGQLRQPVLAGNGQLGRRQRYPFGDRAKPGDGARLAVRGSAKQLSRLAAKLVEVGSVRKLGHYVSSLPGLAFGRDAKTILPESTTM